MPVGNASEYKQGIITSFGDQSLNEAVSRQDWDSQLHDLFLKADLNFVSMIDKMGMGTHPSDSYKIQWGENDEESITVTNASGGSTTTIVVGTDEYKPLLKDDVLYSSILDTYIIVTATPTTTTVAVKRLADAGTAYENLAAADYAAGASYLKIYNQRADGSLELETTLNAISYQKTIADQYNYIGTIEKFSSITQHEANQKWQFSNYTKRSYENARVMKNMLKDMEFATWKGKLFKESTVNAKGLTFGKGVLNFSGVQTQTGVEASFTYDKFLTFIRAKARKYNRNTRKLTCFTNMQGFSFLNKMLMSNSTINWDSQAAFSKDKWGFETFTVRVPHLQFDMVINMALDDLYPLSSFFFFTDLNTIGRRYINDMNLSTTYGVQPKRSHSYLDQFFTTHGIQFNNSERSSMLELT